MKPEIKAWINTRISISKVEIPPSKPVYYVNIDEYGQHGNVWNTITVYDSFNENSAKIVALKLSHVLSLEIKELY